MHQIISEEIVSVYQGKTCWVVYVEGALGGVLKSNHYAIVKVMYSDGSLESFIAPVIPSADGIMTWANYFDTFLGVIHQEDAPSDSQIKAFREDMYLLEQQVLDVLSGKSKELKSEEETTEESDVSKDKGPIKFNPKRRKPKPEGDE